MMIAATRPITKPFNIALPSGVSANPARPGSQLDRSGRWLDGSYYTGPRVCAAAISRDRLGEGRARAPNGAARLGGGGFAAYIEAGVRRAGEILHNRGCPMWRFMRDKLTVPQPED